MKNISCFILPNSKSKSSNALLTNLPFTIDSDKRKDLKYKTELCRKWEETGKCPYGKKCRFAHGKQELCVKDISSNYKRKPCKSFINVGFCLYGSRCSFKHDERTLDDIFLPYFYVQLFILQAPRQDRLKTFEDMNEQVIKKAPTIHSSSTSTISNDEESLVVQSSFCKYNANNDTIRFGENVFDANR